MAQIEQIPDSLAEAGGMRTMLTPDVPSRFDAPVHGRDSKWSRLWCWVRLLRPHQWTKNAFCLAGVLFSGKFIILEADLAALGTCVTFCAISSAVYIFNDVLDRGRDRNHSKKCTRPIASGAISVSAAAVAGIVLALLALAGAFMLGPLVCWCVAFYVLNNLAYSCWFKHHALIDVLSIAISFVLRLLSGVYAVGELPTTWITLCTFFLAVFLGFGKRRAELADVIPNEERLQRPVLSKYTVQFLDYLVNNSATMAVLCYALFTTSGKNPSLVVTVPIVFYAIMHYKRLVVLMKSGEEPDRILLKDYRIQLCVFLWLISYLIVMYGDVHVFR